MHKTVAECSPQSFELRYQSLFREGGVLAFPSDPEGRVHLNAVKRADEE